MNGFVTKIIVKNFEKTLDIGSPLVYNKGDPMFGGEYTGQKKDGASYQ